MSHPDLTFTVAVGFTTSRPVRPDEHTHHVRVLAPTPTHARLFASEMVGVRRGVVMVTRAEILDCIA